MRTASLRALLVSTALASLAAVPLVACGGSTMPVNGSEDGGESRVVVGDGGKVLESGPLHTPFVCKANDLEGPLDALRANLGLDYLELRQQEEYDGGSVRALGAAGTKCNGASDPTSCAQALDAARSETSLLRGCGGCPPSTTYFVFSKGDQVDVVASRAALLSFLGLVDTPAKAWVLALEADYNVDCSSPWIRAEAGSFVLFTTRLISDCPMQRANVLLRVHSDGRVEEIERVELEATGVCAGRRPEGLEERATQAGESAVAAYFAEMAHLEAASVDAFEILEEELRVHGAPSALLRRVRAAAADEVRHARAMASLARRFGASVEAPVVTRGEGRSLEAIAIENAREGCVREAYGALEATFQAEASEDPEIREVMRGIARDETRHAALSLSIASWLRARLSPEARARVDAARAKEIADLTVELGSGPRSEALERVAGRPSPARAVALFASLTLGVDALESQEHNRSMRRSSRSSGPAARDRVALASQ